MPNLSNKGIRIFSFLGLLVSVCLIHYTLDRSNAWLLPIYGLAFFSYFIFHKKTKLKFVHLMTLALIVRLLLFFAPPNLSDDYYRFLWDGQIWIEGINPYQLNPEEVRDNKSFDNVELYQNLNSKQYNTTYPPLSQYIFALPAFLGIQDFFESMSVIRLILLLFELGSILLIFNLTNDVSKTMLYAFNPLVLLELTGNLHFEGVVIFFVLLAIWFFRDMKWLQGSVAMALGILAKLTPLMLLPVLLKKLGIRKAIFSYTFSGIVLILLSLPLINVEVLNGMLTGLDLFFRKFEFNAGLFFLLREIGFWIKGYDTVQTIGPMMSYVAFGAIMAYSILIVNRETKWTEAFTVVMFIQLLMATTVHPWYVIPMVAFSCMTGFAFPILWSLLAFLSYFGYSAEGYEHPMLLILIEYVLIAAIGLFELIKKRPLLNEC